MREPPSLAERVSTLFAAWTTEKQRLNVDQKVVTALGAQGFVLDTETLVALRNGTVTTVDTELLAALAQHFHTNPRYLLDDDPGDLHTQLQLLAEMNSAGVKSIKLRSLPDSHERWGLLRVLSRRRVARGE